MADDNTVRAYRSNEPYRRPAAPTADDAGASSDPLAELARLIGQSDPFAEFGRGRAQGANARDAQLDGHSAPAAVADWRQPAAAPGDSYNPPSADRYEYAAAADARFEHQHADERYDDGQYGNPGHRAAAQDEAYAEQDGYQSDSYDPRAPHVAAQDDEIYDDAPRARRRGGLVTAVVLIGCAMVGSATAYGYRTWYANPSRLEAPPVIAADKTPSKIPAAGDQAGKVIQDRVAGNSGPERMVSREEQPVALKDPGTSAPRVVLAAPVTPSQMPATASAQPAAPAAAAPGEPKRVRTVTIRPDGSDARATATPASPFPPAPAQNLTPPAAQPSAAAPAAARTATPSRAAAPSRNAPLSLNPQGNEATEPAPPAPRMAAVTPAPARTSTNAAASATGGYVVQISSQRSEAEAQASFRSLQAKFPSVLGGRQALVRRADLGEKGTFYRAMVGPFGSSDDATKFCTSLKAAGGQCIIQRN